ncbi:hypothetical protein D3C78_1729010 [compost metagenome]
MYSMVTTTRPASGAMVASGALKALDGLRSSSICRSDDRRCTSSIAITPLKAAMIRLVETEVMDATWPHSAAPSAVPPMMDIW